MPHHRCLLALLGTVLFLPAALPGSVQNGETAPDFTLASASGETVSLSDFAGQYVVLEWVNPGCPFVRKFYEAGAMQAFQADAQERGVAWLSINSTRQGHGDFLNEAESAAWVREKGVKSTWLLDPSGVVGKAYGAQRTPHLFVLGPDCQVLYQGAIDDQNSAHPKTLKGAHNYVFAALDAALEGDSVAVAQTRPYGCGIKY